MEERSDVNVHFSLEKRPFRRFSFLWVILFLKFLVISLLSSLGWKWKYCSAMINVFPGVLLIHWSSDMLEIIVRNSILMKAGDVFGVVFSAACPY